MTRIIRDSPLFCTVSGTFYRAIDPAYTTYALAGSRNPGRYSARDQPTLYLSSSPEGVEAAMMAHRDERTPDLALIEVQVEAGRIVDLRDESARGQVGIELADAVVPWKEQVAASEEPPSWGIRRRLEEWGAHGLIDPSRKAPGLWHLVLFRWNEGGAPQAQLPPPSHDPVA